MIGMGQRRPSRHRVEAPVNEDAELGAGVPLRQRMLVERLERGLVFRGRLRGANAAEATKLRNKTEPQNGFILIPRLARQSHAS